MNTYKYCKSFISTDVIHHDIDMHVNYASLA
jgi:hypothetical protein